MLRIGAWSCICALACGPALAGCMSVPDLGGIAGSRPDDKNSNPKSISINDVVTRVKCEIRDSIADRVGYPWLEKWTAQADLTLLVNQQSGISPGVTFAQPLPFGNIPGRVTNLAQSASLGLGGGVSTTAVRTEIVSFSISIKEIRNQFKWMNAYQLYDQCHPHSAIDLTSNLGLKEWVDSALGPVDNGLLKEGYHKPPKPPGGGGAGAAGGGGAKPQALVLGLEYRDTLADLIKLLTKDDPLRGKIEVIQFEFGILREFGNLLRDIQSATDLTKFDTSAFGKTLTNIDSELKLGPDVFKGLKLTSIEHALNSMGANPTRQQLATLKASVQKAIVIVEKKLATDIPPVVAALQLICDCSPPFEIKDEEFSGQISPDQPPPGQTPPGQPPGKARQSAPTLKPSEIFSNGLKCLKTILSLVQADIPASPPPKDPPIDAISHQVQFFILYNASANPTWTLVRFRGPTPTSGSFASLSQTNTHTLTIVMGEPGSAAVANARGSLTFSAALANQLIPPFQQGQGAAALFIP